MLEWRELWGGGGGSGENRKVLREPWLGVGGGGVKEVVLWTLMGGFMSFGK